MDSTQLQHTNRQYEEELRGVRAGLLKMGGLVERQIAEAMEALVDRDSDHARAVIANDDEVNRMDVENDDTCIRLLALHQPTASDLRFITTGLKITTDLERIGDNAVNICERGIEINEYPQVKPYIDLPRMSEIAQSMVKDSIDAFMRGDVELAQQELEHVLAHRVGDLQPHRRAEAPPRQPPLEGLQEGLVAVLERVDLQDAVQVGVVGRVDPPLGCGAREAADRDGLGHPPRGSHEPAPRRAGQGAATTPGRPPQCRGVRHAQAGGTRQAGWSADQDVHGFGGHGLHDRPDVPGLPHARRVQAIGPRVRIRLQPLQDAIEGLPAQQQPLRAAHQ